MFSQTFGILHHLLLLSCNAPIHMWLDFNVCKWWIINNILVFRQRFKNYQELIIIANKCLQKINNITTNCGKKVGNTYQLYSVLISLHQIRIYNSFCAVWGLSNIINVLLQLHQDSLLDMHLWIIQFCIGLLVRTINFMISCNSHETTMLVLALIVRQGWWIFNVYKPMMIYYNRI